jgi:hypothetical protein
MVTGATAPLRAVADRWPRFGWYIARALYAVQSQNNEMWMTQMQLKNARTNDSRNKYQRYLV